MTKKLLPGDVVLVDLGFDIAESVGKFQRMHIPAFTKGKNQLAALNSKTHKTLQMCESMLRES